MSYIIINEAMKAFRERETENFTIGSRADLYKYAWDAGRAAGIKEAQPKWISVIDNPPNEGDIIFAHDPDEGWIALVKVIRVNLASVDVKAIWPEHSPPFIAKVWTPLRLPEPPKEET